MSTTVVPVIDLGALAAGSGVELNAALEQLDQLYADLDAKNAANTASLDLPCHKGCSACCEHAVFLTPLEFFGAWSYAQTHISDERRAEIVADGLAHYDAFAERIEVFSTEPPGPAHDDAARAMTFRCPFLNATGACDVYPRRELFGRLFGQSFNEDNGIYGCDLVGAHLGGKEVTLLRARPTAQKLSDLPLTDMRQVFPWFIRWLYGARDDDGRLIDAPVRNRGQSDARGERRSLRVIGDG